MRAIRSTLPLLMLTALGCTVVSQNPASDGGAPPALDAGATADAGAGDDSSASHPGSDAASDAGSDASTSTDAPAAPRDAAPVSFTPSNFTTSQIASILASPPAVDTGGGNRCVADGADGSWSCTNGPNPTPKFMQLAMGSGSVTIWVLASLTVRAGDELDFTSPNPAILFVTGDVQIAGTVITRAGSTVGGSGDGSPAGGGANLMGTGGGGASFCGTGGTGFNATHPPDGLPGTPYGSASLIPLLGGSAGGSPGANNGGGALQITSQTSINVPAGGLILAPGSGAGQGSNGGGGGGSGGGILLESPAVTIAGALAANGGGGSDATNLGSNSTGPAQAAGGGSGGGGSFGTTTNGADGGTGNGGGGGGSGRIRINTSSGAASITGTVSPAPSTACMTQGTLMP